MINDQQLHHFHSTWLFSFGWCSSHHQNPCTHESLDHPLLFCTFSLTRFTNLTLTRSHASSSPSFLFFFFIRLLIFLSVFSLPLWTSSSPHHTQPTRVFHIWNFPNLKTTFIPAVILMFDIKDKMNLLQIWKR